MMIIHIFNCSKNSNIILVNNFLCEYFFSIKLSLIISVAIISILLILIGIIILIKYLRQRIINSSIKVNIQSILYLDTIHILFYV
jgi:hypothetical protein